MTHYAPVYGSYMVNGDNAFVPIAAWMGIVLLILAGCVSSGRHGEIPLGAWSGRGTLVYEEFESTESEDQPAVPISIYRTYPTRLVIEDAEIGGTKVLKMTIESERGLLKGIGDRTHLVVVLISSGKRGDDTTLYRPVAMQFNPKPTDTLTIDNAAAAFGASCTTRSNATTCIIEYMEGFVDLIRFSGHSVEKHGSFFKKNEGFIHWNEELRRQD